MNPDLLPHGTKGNESIYKAAFETLREACAKSDGRAVIRQLTEHHWKLDVVDSDGARMTTFNVYPYTSSDVHKLAVDTPGEPNQTAEPHASLDKILDVVTAYIEGVCKGDAGANVPEQPSLSASPGVGETSGASQPAGEVNTQA